MPLVFEELTDKDFAAMNATAQGWRPNVDDEIAGRIVGVSVGQSNVGPNYPIVTILPESAENTLDAVAVHAFHTVLKNKLLGAKPEIGDRIFIKYFGDMGRSSRTKGFSAPQIYAVQIGNKSTSNVWAALSTDVELGVPEQSAESLTWDTLTGEVK